MILIFWRLVLKRYEGFLLGLNLFQFYQHVGIISLTNYLDSGILIWGKGVFLTPHVSFPLTAQNQQKFKSSVFARLCIIN